MPLDDLRGALEDLASRVEPVHEDAFASVQGRGRHHRRRRNGIITSATAAVLVAILFGGIAITGHRQTPPDIATGPPPTPVGSSTSRPPTTTEVCTEADANDSEFGGLPMPAPTRITATRLYENGMVRLDPPPAGAQAKTPASEAWAASHSVYRVATYELVLTSYSAFAPSTGGVPQNWHRLMWVVIGHHVPSVEVGGGNLRPLGVTTVPPPACYFATQLTLFDANTGQELEQMTFGE